MTNGNPPDRFDVDPEPAASGESLSIVYTNPARAGVETTIKMTNCRGENEPGYEEVTYTGTPQSPSGAMGWDPVPSMPDWDSVCLKGPDSTDHPIPHA